MFVDEPLKCELFNSTDNQRCNLSIHQETTQESFVGGGSTLKLKCAFECGQRNHFRRVARGGASIRRVRGKIGLDSPKARAVSIHFRCNNLQTSIGAHRLRASKSDVYFLTRNMSASCLSAVPQLKVVAVAVPAVVALVVPVAVVALVTLLVVPAAAVVPVAVVVPAAVVVAEVPEARWPRLSADVQ